MKLAIACADVGSVSKGNFGWAVCVPPKECDVVDRLASIQEFGDVLVELLNDGHQVALGFECPLFLPLAEKPVDLTKSRTGEGNRPWCAGAGSGAMAIGLVEATWLLAYMKRRIPVSCLATLDWAEFVRGDAHLFLWEAFVSRGAKTGSHHGDAAAAVAAFRSSLPDLDAANAVTVFAAISVIGAALLRSGWTAQLEILAQSCLVIQARGGGEKVQ